MKIFKKCLELRGFFPRYVSLSKLLCVFNYTFLLLSKAKIHKKVKNLVIQVSGSLYLYLYV